MHLARRLQACHDANPAPGGDSVCQFTAAATAEFRQLIVDKELHTFDFDVETHVAARVTALQAALADALANVPGINTATDTPAVASYLPTSEGANKNYLPKISVTMPGVAVNDLTSEEKQELADALIAVLHADSAAALDAMDIINVAFTADTSGNLVAAMVHGVWMWEQRSDGCCGFDLHTTAVRRVFSLFFFLFLFSFLFSSLFLLLLFFYNGSSHSSYADTCTILMSQHGGERL